MDLLACTLTVYIRVKRGLKNRQASRNCTFQAFANYMHSRLLVVDVTWWEQVTPQQLETSTSHTSFPFPPSKSRLSTPVDSIFTLTSPVPERPSHTSLPSGTFRLSSFTPSQGHHPSSQQQASVDSPTLFSELYPLLAKLNPKVMFGHHLPGKPRLIIYCHFLI